MYSSYLGPFIMIYSLFNCLLGLKKSRASKSPSIPGDGPYKLPNKKEELSSALAISQLPRNELLESQLNNNLGTYSLFSYCYQLLVKIIYMSSTLFTRVIPSPIKKKDFFEFYPLLLFLQECQKFIGYINLKLFSIYP